MSVIGLERREMTRLLLFWGKTMAVRYNKLWKRMIDRRISKTELTREMMLYGKDMEF